MNSYLSKNINPSDINLSDINHVHILGIGGSGMNAIATILLSMGISVSGSDLSESNVTKRLKELGAQVYIGHRESNVPPSTQVVAISSAVTSENLEVKYAIENNIPVINRSKILQALTKTRKTIAVAGTHGKTTTTTLTSYVLDASGQEPSWIIGGEVKGRDGGAHWGNGDFFVIEADESDGTFLHLDPFIGVITNVEADHLEHYGSLDNREEAFASLKKAFLDFANKSNNMVICLDDPGSLEIASQLSDTQLNKKVIGYGTSIDHNLNVKQLIIEDVQLNNFDSVFFVKFGEEVAQVVIKIPGMHNIRNACAAITSGLIVGVSLEDAIKGISQFQGVGRRFENKGTIGNVTFVDEYAHLPGEVKAALAAAKAGKWNRVVAVFQPHRYSRTAQVGHEFVNAFDDADLLILTDIYAAGENKREGISGQLVVDAVASVPNYPQFIYHKERETLAAAVLQVLEPGDLCITMGAGDITNLSSEIQSLLSKSET